MLFRSLLEKAAALVAQRHETLRTTFAERDGRVVQIVHPEPRYHFETVFLTQLPEDEKEEALRRALADVAQTSFHLAEGPLWSFRFLQTAPDDAVLGMVMHHIISDGWSTGILFEELAVAYQALCRDSLPDLPPLTIQDRKSTRLNSSH